MREPHILVAWNEKRLKPVGDAVHWMEQIHELASIANHVLNLLHNHLCTAQSALHSHGTALHSTQCPQASGDALNLFIRVLKHKVSGHWRSNREQIPHLPHTQPSTPSTPSIHTLIHTLIHSLGTLALPVCCCRLECRMRAASRVNAQ